MAMLSWISPLQTKPKMLPMKWTEFKLGALYSQLLLPTERTAWNLKPIQLSDCGKQFVWKEHMGVDMRSLSGDSVR